MGDVQVVLASMPPEARDCLDTAMEQWIEHHERIKHTGHRCAVDGSCVYGFAYWLIRYSGLVRPT